MAISREPQREAVHVREMLGQPFAHRSPDSG
jgi:hypothetical protein